MKTIFDEDQEVEEVKETKTGVKSEALVYNKYPSYRVVPLFQSGKTEYFRVTKWGVDSTGDTCIIRSIFLEVDDGKITERKD